MSNIFTRARVWAFVALCGCAPLALGQTVELITGQGRFVDIPGNTVGFQPGAMAIGADGYLYTNDINGRLMRLNTTTGAVTALPATPGGLNHDLGWSWGIAVNTAGVAHVTSQGALHRINPDGTLTRLNDLPVTGPMAYGPDGTIYIVPGDNMVWRYRPHGPDGILDGILDIIAGGFDPGFSGDGGPSGGARLAHPQGVAVGPDGNLYIADTDNHRIRRIDLTTGIITTIAGAGGTNYQGDGIPAAQTDIGSPMGIAIDAAGNLYVGSAGARRVLRIDAVTTLVTTVAGNGSAVMSGDDGPATAAGVSWPQFVAVDSRGNVFFADSDSYKYIRKVDAVSGVVSRALGFASMYFCGEGVPANQGCLAQPVGVDVGSGNVVVSDAALMRLRRITGNTIATFATPTAAPSGIDHDQAGNLYVMGGNKVTRYDRITGAATVVAGGNGPGFFGDGGPATAARMGSVGDVAVDAAGNIFISDTMNNRVRKVTAATGIITSIGTYASPATLGINSVGELFVSEGCRIHRIIISNNFAAPWAGTGTCATFDPSGNSQPLQTNLGPTRAFAIDPANNNMYLGWSNQLYRIRYNTLNVDLIRNPPQGLVTAEGVMLERPTDMSVDSAGRLYIVQDYKPYLFRVSGLNDATAPVITANITGLKGLGNWYRSDVSVTFTISDPESYALIDGCAPGAVTADTGQQSIDFHCHATSLGGQRFSTVSIRRDTVPPTITWRGPTPAADASGWIYRIPYFEFTGWDGISGSGINNSASTQGPIWIYTEGTGLTISATMVDNAGNTAVFTSPPVNVARTVPVIQEQVTGTLGNNGWYRSDVQVGWNIGNAPTITSSSGCGATVVGSDTAGTTFTCTVTTPAGTTTKSVTVKRDATPPVVSFGALSPLPNADGWNNSAVDVAYTASDAMSGVASATPASPLVFGQPGAAQSMQVQVVDLAGNTASAQSPIVNIDQAPPTITVTVAGTPGNDGWYRSDVQVQWMVDSPLSPAQLDAGCTDSVLTTDTAEATFTCNATNAGGSATKSVTFKLDKTPPTLSFGAAAPAPDEAGWRAGPVSVPFDASDALSGIASTSSASPLAITQSGAGTTGQVVVTDVAGNSATFTTPVFNIDGTPPELAYIVHGTQSGNGSDWYRTDARVVFTGLDAQGSLVTKQGDCDVTLTTDSPGTTYTCTATSAGGTTSSSVTIRRDATPPTLTWGAASPAPNGIGWNTTDVTFPYTAADSTSGVSGNSQGNAGPVLVSFDGPGVSNQITIFDAAGNAATFFTPPVNIDRSPPVVNAIVSGTAGNNGWYTSDVQLTWQIGKAPQNILSQTGCENTTLTADTGGTTFNCSVASGAGTTSSSVTIKRDATPPVLSFGTPSPVPNASGWNKTNVSIAFTRSDAMSGLASTSAASPLVLSTEGANLTREVVVVDNAGNSATFTSVPRNIDKTVPYAEMETPVDGGTYGFYQDVAADFVCEDLSLVSCTSPTPQGGLINTRTAGARTFRITAKDAAGFTTNHTHSFTVESTFNFGGFLAPASPPPTLNLVTRGALVPIRWQLPDGRGGFVTNPTSFTSATVGSLTCGSTTSVPLNDTASGPAGISFDAATNSFVYNWQTSASWTGCRKLTIKLKDNSVRELRFRFQ
jgi:sugar lactone lactonase YvrE